jgi:divalent metal cation (Fe/Co/Zn/Cd) transporter
MSTPKPFDSPADLRAAVRVSVVSVAWTLATSAAAIVAGIVDHTLVLLVFGLTGLLDAVGSAALTLHFRHALKHERVSEERERVALRIVSAGLLVIGVSTTVESVRRLIGNAPGHGSSVGTAIVATSLVVLALLTVAKRRAAVRVSSRALWADSWLSATGIGLSAITIAGVVAGKGRGWVDPVAALVVAAAAGAVGVAALRSEEKELT